MWYRNDAHEEAENLQNRFTAYLVTAVRRRKTAYLNQRNKVIQMEYHIDEERRNFESDVQRDLINELPLLMRLENDSLMCALKHLSERERYVFLGRALDETSFEELAAELGVSYKGVAAIYYRTIRKIQNYMREVDK